MSSIIRKKNRLNKHINNSQAKMQMIYEWTSRGQLRRDEFFELINYAQLGISKQMIEKYRKKKAKEEDPEDILP